MTDPILYAVALADPGALYSPRAHPFVAVVCGVLHANDAVEIVRADGTTRLATIKSLPGRCLTSADPDGQITFADLAREDLAPGDGIRAPGLKTPPLSLDGPGAVQRLHLLHSVKAARKDGFATGYAPLISHLPDEVVVLFLEKVVRDALRPPRSPYNIRTAFDKAARLYEAVWLPEDGDRLRLAAAALLEGRPLGWDLMALTSAVLGGTTGEQSAESAQQALDTLSEMAREKLTRVSALDRREFAAEGEAIRQDLQQRGRAIALGWCSRCKEVVRLNPNLRCAKGHEQITDIRVVTPSEAEETERSLRRRHH
jgi:hypothetical protein